MNEKFDLIKNKIDEAFEIALICHIRPDGDTLGSALALQQYLLNLNKKAHVFCDDSLPQKYDFLKNYELVLNGEMNNELDLILCLDCSDIKRTGRYSSKISRHKNTVNIDHHISNENYAVVNYVEDADSTCEIVLDILEYYGAVLDKDICTCLYSGLSSDTGNFSHSNTTCKTFKAAAKLAEKIGDISYINQRIFKEMPLNKLKLLAEVLKNIKIFADGKMALLTVSMQNLRDCDCDSHETEGFVDYAVNVCGVEIGAILLESDVNTYKISLRSKKINVCKIAAEFGGGGHIHASGCMLIGGYEDVVNKLVKNAGFYL